MIRVHFWWTQTVIAWVSANLDLLIQKLVLDLLCWESISMTRQAPIRECLHGGLGLDSIMLTIFFDCINVDEKCTLFSISHLFGPFSILWLMRRISFASSTWTQFSVWSDIGDDLLNWWLPWLESIIVATLLWETAMLVWCLVFEVLDDALVMLIHLNLASTLVLRG